MAAETVFASADPSQPIASEPERSEPALEPKGSPGSPATLVEQVPRATPLPSFLKAAKFDEIRDRIASEISDILRSSGFGEWCALALLEPEDSIDAYDLDKVFNALSRANRTRDKNVMLLLLSGGGNIEAAYQISKLCKSFAAERFTVIVPRHAKSAATMIAIGADEIHMGPLGQLGPIDPQLDGLQALGVSQALRTIASVAQKYPGSADMFARYLKSALTVEQIGYCDRISESAEQYAVRLLSTKANLPKKAETIAKELVHLYKHHGFVIDLEEARMHLGNDWIKTGTPEVEVGEAIYSLLEMANFFLGFHQSKRILVSGGAGSPDSVLVLDKK